MCAPTYIDLMNISNPGWQCSVQEPNSLKTPTGMRSLLDLLVKAVQKIPKIPSLLLFPLSPPTPQQVEVESLLLKIQWTSDTGPRGPWAVTDLNSSSQKAPCKLPKQRSNQQSYPGMIPITTFCDLSILGAWGRRIAMKRIEGSLSYIVNSRDVYAMDWHAVSKQANNKTKQTKLTQTDHTKPN